MIAAVVRSLRPRQWTKNLLVAAAPLAAGSLFDTPVWWQTLVAFVAFCGLSGAVYLVNDVVDVESDRAHPRKRLRPIAAGELSERTALVVATVLGVASIAAGTAVNWHLGVLLLSYAVLQAAYSLWLKHEPVFDLAVVSIGFLMRAVAGGLAAGLPLSDFFLMVAGFGSLFMVAGKRYAEMMLAERTGAKIRKSLESYSASYLRYIWSLSATVMIMTYSLWAFEIRETHHNTVWSVISIVPFVIAVLRYAVDVDSGNGGAPEEIAFRDHVLQVLGLAWAVSLGLGYYL